jgi:ABC-2 type transport system ATP-binding protein
MNILLKTYELTKSYGKLNAVDKLNIEVLENQVYAILGPNGSGKSTTLGMLLGTLKPSNGHFEWFGANPKEENVKKMGALLETPRFYEYMSGWNNLKLVASIKQCPEENIEYALTLVGLLERSKDKVHAYSMGMKQRLGIAAAIINKPKVLILDEPTNGLDPQGIADIRKLIIKLAEEGISIILASHLLNEVEMVSTHLCILKTGECQFQGSIDKLKEKDFQVFQIGASDLERLSEVLKQHTGLNKIIPATNKFLKVHIARDMHIEDLTNHLAQNGIIVNHILEEKSSLEKEFLKLLEE